MPISSQLDRQTGPSRDDVAAAVKKIVSEETGVPPEQINESHDLVADLGCDSLTLIEITMEVEDHFGIDVPDEISEQTRRVGDVIDGVVEQFESGPEQ